MACLSRQLLVCSNSWTVLCVSMHVLETKISSHIAETTDIVLELKTEVDALHDKLEVIH